MRSNPLASSGGRRPPAVIHCHIVSGRVRSSIMVAVLLGTTLGITACLKPTPGFLGAESADSSDESNSDTTSGSVTATDGSESTTGSSAGDGTAGDCPAPYLACDPLCVDGQIDEDHCGACDIACVPGEACNAGSCAAS